MAQPVCLRVCRALAASEARLAAAHTRLQEQEQAGQQAAAELEAMGQHLSGMDAEYAALREEYRAVTDDLAALVKENQVSWRQVSAGAELGCCVVRDACWAGRGCPTRSLLLPQPTLAPTNRCSARAALTPHCRPAAPFCPAAQVVSNQLSGMTAERQELADQVKLHSTRSHYNEQLARAREQDVSGGWMDGVGWWVQGERIPQSPRPSYH